MLKPLGERLIDGEPDILEVPKNRPIYHMQSQGRKCSFTTEIPIMTLTH